MTKEEEFLLCTTEVPEGYKLKKTLGMAWGSQIRSARLWDNIRYFFKWNKKNMQAPDLKMVMDARRGCMDQMIAASKKLGGNGVVGVRITGFNLRLNTVEFTAYGTAVLVEKAKK
jgi:uncharacterized protein YbjQ (UPF0145 family)